MTRDGKRVQMSFSYYENGRAYAYENALGETESLAHDLFRKRTEVEDPEGGVRGYQYDALGALTELTEPDGARLSFANTPEGLRWQKSDGLGFETKYSYRADRSLAGGSSDTGGNVTREQDPLGQNVDTNYGVHDQVTLATDRRGTTTTTSYHCASGPCAVIGRPQRVTLSSLSGQSNVVLKDYCWNADGTLATHTEYLEPGNLMRTRVTSYSYQAGSGGLNVSELRVTGSDGATRRITFGYDSLGRKTTETVWRRRSATDATQVGLTTTWAYDSLDRVTRVTDAVGQVEETVYDANGQMSQRRERRTINGSFQYRTTMYGYDAADRLVRTIDPIGTARG